MSLEHVDVLIVGAGLSGIGAAHHIQAKHPRKTYALLEAREAIGGTWDLFRYPGIRSDSDMFTLGYGFKPWTDAKAIADGPSILEYVRETARESGIDRHIRFHHRVVRAEWSTPDARWTVEAERTDTGETVTLTCGFLCTNTGYYRYDEGYTPHFEGRERFGGEIVHPQHWPEDLDHAGKRVVIIGSGATAVTLVPAMASTAEHVTMLQRSPSYVLAVPQKDPIANAIRKVLPSKAAYSVARWKNVAMQMTVYELSRRRPSVVKGMVRKQLEAFLPKGFDIDTHFTPTYDPWDQRLCIVPSGDLFRALTKGTASVVTDGIETFTETGVKLRSGAELEADIIITATGLNLLAVGGMQLAVDGEDVELPKAMAYKGMMLEGVPNFALTIGYTNASWTLKADLVAEYVCRLLAHMDETGTKQCVPVNTDPSVKEVPFLDLASGYVQRAIADLPRQGSKAPWRLRQNYPRDVLTLRHGSVTDDAMRFSSPALAARAPEPAAA